jgi:hypothetical protein
MLGRGNLTSEKRTCVSPVQHHEAVGWHRDPQRKGVDLSIVYLESRHLWRLCLSQVERLTSRC